MQSLPQVFHVTLFGLFLFGVFGILGLQVFSGQFSRCNDVVIDGRPVLERADCVEGVVFVCEKGDRYGGGCCGVADGDGWQRHTHCSPPGICLGLCMPLVADPGLSALWTWGIVDSNANWRRLWTSNVRILCTARTCTFTVYGSKFHVCSGNTWKHVETGRDCRHGRHHFSSTRQPASG